MYCGECGQKIGDAEVCPYCHCRNRWVGRGFDAPDQPEPAPCLPGAKSRITAGLLQLFTGLLGIGRFYLGYTAIGILQVAVSAVTCGMGGLIWGVIDGIMILSGRVERDGKGNEMTA